MKRKHKLEFVKLYDSDYEAEKWYWRLRLSGLVKLESIRGFVSKSGAAKNWEMVSAVIADGEYEVING